MYLIYIDESGDEKRSIGNTRHFVLSALMVPADHWNDVFSAVKTFRAGLKQQYGIYMKEELHATDFVAGRGRLGSKIVTKFERSLIFRQTLEFVSRLPNILILNVCLENTQGSVLITAFDRLLNRIQRATEELRTQAVLVVDEGKEQRITGVVRKMKVFNPIPSRFGSWGGGQKTRNITLTRLIEDPFFKPSMASYFLQIVDFVAFACLRREEPTPKVRKYGLEKAFEVLKPVLVLKASPSDPFGIIRR